MNITDNLNCFIISTVLGMVHTKIVVDQNSSF